MNCPTCPARGTPVLPSNALMATENTNDRPMGQPLDMSRGTPARRRDKRDTWDRWDTWDISKLNGDRGNDSRSGGAA
jgi:hypothetical protein